MDVIIAPQSEATVPSLPKETAAEPVGIWTQNIAFLRKKKPPRAERLWIYQLLFVVYTIFVKSKILWFFLYLFTARLADAFQPY